MLAAEVSAEDEVLGLGVTPPSFHCACHLGSGSKGLMYEDIFEERF